MRSIEIDAAPVPIAEEVVIEKPFCRLLHFRRQFESKAAAKSGKRNDPTVLIVAPLSGHHATLLRDTVRTLLPNHDVYITDLGSTLGWCRLRPGGFTSTTTSTT